MLGIIFYILFTSLFFMTFYFAIKKPINIIYTLLVASQFNVTSFFKFGLTFSFFEVNLIICLFIFGYFSLEKSTKISLIYTDRIFLYFLLFSFISIAVALLRVGTGDLNPDNKFPVHFLSRSFMSLNKLFIFLPCLILIREFLRKRYSMDDMQVVFIKALVISGILPMVATIIQFSGIGFYLIHNNPSFAEVYRLENYTGQRIVGLSNEASFFVYQLFFPTLGIYLAFQKKIFSSRKLWLLTILFLIAVIVSISRTGLLMFLLFGLLITFRRFKKNIFQFILKFTIWGPILFVILIGLSTLNIGGFNLAERFLSTFQVDADGSTLDRYGSTEALFNLIRDKCLLFGTGIYNYQYYIKSYLPYYMDSSQYGAGEAPSSFNFILQLIAEFGLPLALIFFSIVIFQLSKCKDILVKDWFLFLFLFSLSFQTLNFAVPFLILLYPLANSNEYTLRFR